MVIGGFILWIIGVVFAACALPGAGTIAVCGLLAVLGGGLLRVYSI